jgi:hypothetical protein
VIGNTVGVSTKAKSAIVFLLLVFAVSVSTNRSVYAAPPLALDALGVNTTCQAFDPIFHTTQLCDAQSLTTTQGYDAIILVAMCGCPAISSIIDSSGLTFAQRVSYSGFWEFYARTTSPLRSDNITVVFSHGWMHGIQVLAIQGANTRAIFDPNASTPKTVPCSGVGLMPCSGSITTSTIDFVVVDTAINDAGPCGVVHGVGGVAGFTTIKTNRGYGGWFEVDYAITTEPQSSIVFNCTVTDPIAMVMDAISFHGAFGGA